MKFTSALVLTALLATTQAVRLETMVVKGSGSGGEAPADGEEKPARPEGDDKEESSDEKPPKGEKPPRKDGEAPADGEKPPKDGEAPADGEKPAAPPAKTLAQLRKRHQNKH